MLVEKAQAEAIVQQNRFKKAFVLHKVKCSDANQTSVSVKIKSGSNDSAVDGLENKHE